MAATKTIRHGEFEVVESGRALAMNFAQKMGRALWVPMLLMGVMAFLVAFILGAIRANLVDTGTTVTDAAGAAALGQYITAIMFFGFMSVFSGIVFAIARILGVLRTGGGQIQETARRRILTLKMPTTAWGMILMMMMGMMMLLFAIITHVVLGVAVHDAVLNGNQGTIQTVTKWATWVEGLRRFGVATYLGSIAFGLATIIQVLRFQAARVRELAQEEPTHPTGLSSSNV